MADDSHSANLLLVSGDVMERSVVENILAGGGYAVHWEPSLASVRDPLPSSLDLFLIMQDAVRVTGETGVRALIDMAAQAEIPVLFLGDSSCVAPLTVGIDGPVDCLTPPFEREPLLMRVRILVQLRHMRRELRQVHDQLLVAQKMECVGALAAGVAHEFNNLMCSVVGFAELARADGGQDIQALRECADVAYEAAKRATATAASLLAFSRQVRSPKTMANVNDAVTSAVRLLRRDIEKDNITVQLALNTLPETAISMAPLQQVFLNLIINAWHAMREVSGERRLTLSSHLDASGRIMVKVEDTGCGIPLDKQDRIFEPFYTTKTGNKGIQGTGLGLAVVREVIRDHRGEVWVESEVEKGARFMIALPVEQVTEPPDAACTVPAGDQRRTVLVVDDEEANRKALTRLLSRRGHEAYAAANMAEAITILWSCPVDMIVLDMVMPGTAGPMNVKLLRDDGIEAPILLCTGNVDEAAISKAMSYGANGLLRKPFAAADFLSAMEQCMTARRNGMPAEPG